LSFVQLRIAASCVCGRGWLWSTGWATLPLFRTLVRNQDIQNGAYDIHWLENFLKDGGMGDLT